MLATSTEAALANGARQPARRSRSVWAAAWVIGVFVLCPGRLTIGVGGDPLGSSFVATLEQGLNSGLHWGSQVVWTYGPFGALDFNLGTEPRILFITLLVRLLTHVVFLSLLATVFWYRKVPPWLWVASGLCFFVLAAAGPLELNTECVLIGAVTTWLALSVDRPLAFRWRLALMSFGGIALALASLDKISDTLDAVGILLVVTVHSVLVRRHLRAAAAGWASWLAGWLLLWMLAGQRLQDIPPFARTAFELISGYSSAMANGAASWVTLLAALIVASLFGATVLLTVRRRPELALATALSTAVVFLLFKEGFVRADPIHIDWFLVPSVYMLVTLAAIALTGPTTSTPERGLKTATQHRDRSPVVLASATGVAVVALLVAAATYPQLVSSWSFTDRVAGYGGALASILSPGQREAVRAEDLTHLAALYGVPATILDKVRGGTVDVLPWFNAAPLVYGVPGAQQPVMQSYSAYTSYLDGLDAAFFAGPNAPDFILISYLPIDERLLQFDEPLVVRALMDDYRVDPLSNGAYVLLDRHPRPARPPDTPLSDECVSIGQQVTVPQLPSERVYAHVRVSLSALGFIRGLAYRPHVLYITITTLDHSVPLEASQTRTFRFVSGTAGDGLLVSGLATDPYGLARLLAGKVQGGAITSFRITTDSPGQYDQQMCVRFESTAAS